MRFQNFRLGLASRVEGGGGLDPLLPNLTDEHKQFLSLIADPAISSEVRYGIPAGATIAQAILESGWGQSSLFKLANNPFGIKYSDSSPDAQYGYIDLPTHEFIDGHSQIVTAGFQHFPNLFDAFSCHALLLRHPHYAAAWKHRGDARMYAMCLGPKSESNPDGCGYATDPEYGRKLIDLIDELDLTNAGEHYGRTEVAAAGEKNDDVPADHPKEGVVAPGAPRQVAPSPSSKSSESGVANSGSGEESPKAAVGAQERTA